MCDCAQTGIDITGQREVIRGNREHGANGVFRSDNLDARDESLRMVSAVPVGNEPVSDEELRPHVLEGS